ncbi:MAG TPA: RDD family protein [Terriglobales bacterium]|jgi:uncharacterized RDD family membrane protein YckC
MTVDYKYSTFWPRFWAGWVDGLVFLPITLFDNYLSSPARTGVVLIVWAVFRYLSEWLYSVSLHSLRGQTVGKKSLDVKVMDVSEERIPTLRQSVLRDIGGIIAGACWLVYFGYLVIARKYVGDDSLLDQFPVKILLYANLGWFLLELVTMLTNSKRRALHDVIAGTVVVRV